jgi:hypothetical protein
MHGQIPSTISRARTNLRRMFWARTGPQEVAQSSQSSKEYIEDLPRAREPFGHDTMIRTQAEHSPSPPQRQHDAPTFFSTGPPLSRASRVLLGTSTCTFRRGLIPMLSLPQGTAHCLKGQLIASRDSKEAHSHSKVLNKEIYITTPSPASVKLLSLLSPLRLCCPLSSSGLGPQALQLSVLVSILKAFLCPERQLQASASVTRICISRKRRTRGSQRSNLR